MAQVDLNRRATKWMSIAVIGALSALATVDGPAQAENLKPGNAYFVQSRMIACIQRTDLEQFLPLARSNDHAAFDNLRQERIVQFRCVDLIKGAKVYLDNLDWGRACVRSPGARECIWTVGSVLGADDPLLNKSN
jgi:hypothetical protein